MHIKVQMPNLDIARYASKAIEASVHDTMSAVRTNWVSKSPKASVNLSFSKSGDQFVGRIELRGGWNNHRQSDQLSIQTPSRQPVSSLNRTPNQLPQWGRMTPSKATIPATIGVKREEKSNEARDIYFTSSSVTRRGSLVHDTFLEVFGNNAKYLTGQKGGL